MSPAAKRLLAEVSAAKRVAMANFERTWGTRDVSVVMGALRETIPNSTSPTDAAQKAHAILKAVHA